MAFIGQLTAIEAGSESTESSMLEINKQEINAFEHFWKESLGSHLTRMISRET